MSDKLIGNDLSCSIFVSVTISTPLSQLVRETFKIEKNKKSVSHGNTDFYLHFRTNLDIHIRPF